MGGSPITFGFPGMQVNPLSPSRRTVIFPSASMSATLADLAMVAGAADRARAIFTSTDSPCNACAIRNTNERFHFEMLMANGCRPIPPRCTYMGRDGPAAPLPDQERPMLHQVEVVS